MINQEFFKERENLKHCNHASLVIKQLLWLSVFSTPYRVCP